MRDKFNEQLEQLNVELIKMGALCEEAISAAAKALLEGDAALRETAAAAEREIDQKERDIESLCMKLLLQQQPVARDLRTISAALKMISDMERIGDQASDIAEITRDIEDSPVVSHVPIAEMARSTIGMVTDSIDSFVRKNLGLAQEPNTLSVSVTTPATSRSGWSTPSPDSTAICELPKPGSGGEVNARDLYFRGRRQHP